MLEKIMMIAWSMQKRRNKKVFENDLFHPREDVDRALSLLKDFESKNGNLPMMKSSLNSIAWKAPLVVHLKLNVDVWTCLAHWVVTHFSSDFWTGFLVFF